VCSLRNELFVGEKEKEKKKFSFSRLSRRKYSNKKV
jgi:hypothetical protein